MDNSSVGSSQLGSVPIPLESQTPTKRTIEGRVTNISREIIPSHSPTSTRSTASRHIAPVEADFHAAIPTDSKEIEKVAIKKSAQFPDEFEVAMIPQDGKIDYKKIALLISQGIDVTAPFRNGEPPLQIAATKNDARLFRMLLSAGAQVGDKGTQYARIALSAANVELLAALVLSGGSSNLPQEIKDEAILLACQKGHIPLMKALIHKGANVEAVDHSSQKNILHIAVERAINEVDYAMLIFVCEDLKLKNLSLLLHGTLTSAEIPLILVGKSGDRSLIFYMTSLYKKLDLLDTHAAEFLKVILQRSDNRLLTEAIRAGLNVNAPDLTELIQQKKESNSRLTLVLTKQIHPSQDELVSLLQDALKDKRIADAQKLLQECGVDLSWIARVGRTLLAEAVKSKDPEAIRFVVEELKITGKILTDHTRGNLSALERCIDGALVEMTAYLLPHCTHEGLLQISRVQEDPLFEMLYEFACYHQNMAIVQDLVIGKKILPTDGQIQKILELAVRKANIEVIKVLVTNSPQLVSPTANPESNLAFIAAATGNVDIFRFIMEDLHFEQHFQHASEFEALLPFAARAPSSEVLKFLIEKGVSLTATDKAGMTALHHAAQKGSFDCVKMLLSKGAAIDSKDANSMTPFALAHEAGNREAIKAFIEENKASFVPIDSEQMGKILQLLYTFKRDNPKQKIDFDLFLLDRGFSTHIQNLDFRSVSALGEEQMNDLFKNVNLTGITFENCMLSQLNFTNATLTDCRFQASDMSDCTFVNATLTNCQFQSANLTECRFEEGVIKNSLFSHGCNFSYAGINDCDISSLTIDACTLFGTNFLGSKVQTSKISNSNLENCLLFHTRSSFAFQSCQNEGVVTLPTVAIAWSTESPLTFATKAVKSIKASQAIPIKFNFLPSKVNADKLQVEVKDLLQEISKEAIQSSSRPHEMLIRAEGNEENNPQIVHLSQKAKLLNQYVDSILLPGGADIHPEFYGQPTSDQTTAGSDYTRTVYEFAAIRYAREMGVPLMGICRGSQMGNIFYGGALRQNVPHQMERQYLEPIVPGPGEAVGLIRGIALGKEQDKEMFAASHHHQASTETGINLEAVLEYKGVVKALESQVGVPIMLLQFHPEELDPFHVESNTPEELDLSAQNYAFFQAFREAANQHRKRRNLTHQIKKPQA